MKIIRHQIRGDIGIKVDEEISYSKEDFSNTYPLLDITKAHAEGEIYQEEGTLFVNLHIDALVILSDARTCKPFNKQMEVEEEAALLKDASEEGEGYIFEDEEIELKDVVKCMLISALPINPMDENSTLPKGNKTYSILSEDDALSNKEGDYDPRFDILDGYEP